MYPAFQALSGKRVILASQSPRRQQIFCSVGFTPEFVPSGFPEDFDWRPFGPRDYVSFNAKKKVEWISDGLYGGEKEPVLIVGCDTVVSCDEQVLEKARDREHAAEMLRMISGKVLRIYSGTNQYVSGLLIYFEGVYIQYRGKDGALKEANFVDVVQVRMRQYDDAIINGYLDLGYGL